MSDKVFAVFEAADRDELATRYDEWASEYDGDLVNQGGPAEAVEMLLKHVPSRQAKILDAGCGTGVVGQLLAQNGYRNLEGLDLSAGMLDEARKKQCYSALTQQALGDPLDFPTGIFDAVLSVGVFVRGHAPASSFDELIRITKPGGTILFTLRPEFYAGTDFKAKLSALTHEGRWLQVEVSAPFDGRFKFHPEVTLQVWVYKISDR
ncbi:MAG: class I SAM-dependent DNA methyltransferase [Methylococcales bacterium]